MTLIHGLIAPSSDTQVNTLGLYQSVYDSSGATLYCLLACATPILPNNALRWEKQPCYTKNCSDVACEPDVYNLTSIYIDIQQKSIFMFWLVVALLIIAIMFIVIDELIDDDC